MQNAIGVEPITNWLRSAQPGDAAIYYHGFLAKDLGLAESRSGHGWLGRRAVAIQTITMNEWIKGRALLFQRRIADELYDYIIVRKQTDDQV